MKGQIPVNSKSQSMGQSSREPRRSPQNCKTNGGQNHKEKGQDPSLLQITEQNYSAQPDKQWPGTARRAARTSLNNLTTIAGSFRTLKQFFP